jgi:hypothetical protein
MDGVYSGFEFPVRCAQRVRIPSIIDNDRADNLSFATDGGLDYNALYEKKSHHPV